MRRLSTTSGLVMLVLLSLVAVQVVLAVSQPEGPSTLSVELSERRQAAPTQSHDAEAGNVTHLVMEGSSVTQSWQGYVGNITGTITLDDSSNYTLYDWTLANPSGEVYATNASTVDWSTGNVVCWNWSDAIGSERQLAEIEDGYGIATNDVDGVNETFSCDRCDGNAVADTHTDFYVGGQFINGSNNEVQGDPSGGPCPNVKLYNGSNTRALADFEVVLLYEETENEVIYTSLLQNSKNGYNNQTWDFEMIVGENGHDGDIQTTTYYFYVELE